MMFRNDDDDFFPKPVRWIFDHFGLIFITIFVIAILIVIAQVVGVGYVLTHPEALGEWLSKVLAR